MSSLDIDFITGTNDGTTAGRSSDRPERDLGLRYACPVIDDDREAASAVLRNEKRSARDTRGGDALADDGLYVSENPFTDKLVKPYRLDDVRPLDYVGARPRLRGRLVDIAIREVRLLRAPPIEIASVSIRHKGRQVCKTHAPFNRKLHRLLIRDREWHDLAILVHARRGESSLLPLPLPRHSVKDHRMEIEFAIGDHAGLLHAGTVVCTVSLSTARDDDGAGVGGPDEAGGDARYFYGSSNDPNDPRNALYPRPRRTRSPSEIATGGRDANYFLLLDPALTFDAATAAVDGGATREPPKPPDVVLTEQPAFSLLDVSFGNLFRANRPLMPSSGSRRHRHTLGRTALSVTVLRGVEVPVREESALVSPLLEVEWCDAVRATSVADGPAPVWQQTVHFEPPRPGSRSGGGGAKAAASEHERGVKLRLYDQHPVWGQQWLGEARIPLERHRSYQELERWVALSPLFSPAMSFGYVRASPGQSHTRIYVLMKMEQAGGGGGDADSAADSDALDALSKGVQRCLATPYRLAGVETPDEAARLAALLTPLPARYGPVAPRQALSVNKVDHYGRAALLASLLQGFGLRSYVLLGTRRKKEAINRKCLIKILILSFKCVQNCNAQLNIFNGSLQF